jgi:hypothetical protein
MQQKHRKGGKCHERKEAALVRKKSAHGVSNSVRVGTQPQR